MCNGIVCKLGDSADPELDTILVDGKSISKSPDKVYIMLNKPRGFVTTLSDEKGCRNVAELVVGHNGAGAHIHAEDADIVKMMFQLRYQSLCIRSAGLKKIRKRHLLTFLYHVICWDDYTRCAYKCQRQKVTAYLQAAKI